MILVQHGYPFPSSNAAIARMKANPSRDTRPEVALRAALHARGLRFRKDYMVQTAAGTKSKVDVVFTRARVAVFMDGCFWHGCPDHGTTPRANGDYWAAKLTRNRERDLRVTAALRREGWTVLRLWEHEPLAEAVQSVVDAVTLTRPKSM